MNEPEAALAGAALTALPAYRRDRRTLAVHEAAHAVLAAIFRIPMQGARVFEEGDHIDGAVDLDRARIAEAATLPEPPEWATQRAAIELAAMYAAGVLAELRFHNIPVPARLELDCPDWRNARRVLALAFGGTDAFSAAQRIARRLIEERWTDIRAIAERIDLDGAIAAEDVRQRISAPVGRSSPLDAWSAGFLPLSLP